MIQKTCEPIPVCVPTTGTEYTARVTLGTCAITAVHCYVDCLWHDIHEQSSEKDVDGGAVWIQCQAAISFLGCSFKDCSGTRYGGAIQLKAEVVGVVSLIRSCFYNCETRQTQNSAARF